MTKHFSNSARGYFAAIMVGIIWTLAGWLFDPAGDKNFTWIGFLFSAGAGYMHYVWCEFKTIKERVRDLENRVKYIPKSFDE